jgi:methionyl-tRNA formyltransferase
LKKRLVLITQGVSRIVTPVLEQDSVEVVGIAESAPRDYSLVHSKTGALLSVIRSIYRMGRSVETLEKVAQKRGIPYFLLHKSNQSDFKLWLKDRRVDLVVIYSMSQLLEQDVIKIPSLGILNLHPSLLPSYRGPNPSFWMYYDAVRQGGVTLHYVDSGEDTGDIVYQRNYDIELGIRSTDLDDKVIGKHGVDLILEALEWINQGRSLPRLPQPEYSPTVRARNIKPEEHRTLIDWAQWPVERIWHLMRGTESWMDCIDQPRGIYSGQRWIVDHFEKTKTRKLEQPVLASKPRRDAKGYYVQCRDGIIRIHVGFRAHLFLRALVMRILK